MTMHRSLQRLASLDRRCSTLWSIEPRVAVDRRDVLLRRLSAIDHELVVLNLRYAHANANQLDDLLDEIDGPLERVETELEALARSWTRRSAA